MVQVTQYRDKGKDTVKFTKSARLAITNLNMLQLLQRVGAMNGEFSIKTSQFS